VPASTATLTAVYEEARTLGLLGPGPVERHVEHAARFVDRCPRPPAFALDLGTGAGVPGLVLALAWPASRWVLLDASERRTAFLDRAVRRLGLTNRVQVLRARAEEAAHRPRWREAFDTVVARGFGPPAVVAECATGFLAPGGVLLVSEPPAGKVPAGSRWPAKQLREMGLVVRAGDGPVAVLEKTEPCPAGLPRRVGVPAKRPRF
jgi:16S rRNA (guanine527-N7)-methyltransferase